MSEQLTHFVDGKRAALDSTRTSPIFNPSTGRQSGEVLLASKADTERVIASSQAAFEHRAKLSSFVPAAHRRHRQHDAHSFAPHRPRRVHAAP